MGSKWSKGNPGLNITFLADCFAADTSCIGMKNKLLYYPVLKYISREVQFSKDKKARLFLMMGVVSFDDKVFSTDL